VAGAAGLVHERGGLDIVGRDDARHDERRRQQLLHCVEAVACAGSSSSDSPSIEHMSKKKRGERRCARSRSTSTRLPKRDIVTWNGAGRAILAQRNRLAVEHELARAACAHGLDQLRHGRRDLVQPARVDAHDVALAVHLHARAVQLVVERGAVQARQCVLHVVGRLREHRLQRPEQLHAERAARRAAGERGACDVAQAAGVLRSAPHIGERQSGRARDGIGHDALERALPQLTPDEACEEVLLVFGRAARAVP
jgi:hypothetical protein